MTAKLDPFAAAPALMQEWQRTSVKLAVTCNFEPALTELVKIRASQINGCANCINLHAVEARARGETEQRVYLVSARRFDGQRRRRKKTEHDQPIVHGHRDDPFVRMSRAATCAYPASGVPTLLRIHSAAPDRHNWRHGPVERRCDH